MSAKRPTSYDVTTAAHLGMLITEQFHDTRVYRRVFFEILLEWEALNDDGENLDTNQPLVPL